MITASAVPAEVFQTGLPRSGQSPGSCCPPPVGAAERISQLVMNFQFMHRVRKRGEYLFRAGDEFHAFYVLNAGYVKTSYVSEDGCEQTIGLQLRGDILGLDALATGVYGCDAVTLDACDILAIPFDALIASSQKNPALVREIYQVFSAEIRADRDLMHTIRRLTAMGRVAAFLLDMSARFASRGFSGTHLQLRLTRREIGSMLGLELETVSRAISHLAQSGLIAVNHRDILLLDRDALDAFIKDAGGQKSDRERRSGVAVSTAFVSPAAG